jgi:NAD(P)-dependent dehydrogenase (short-subunit alcohol dehydrogenase family)
MAELRFDGETVLVAGGGGSIGGAYCRLLASRGANVVVNDVGDSADRIAKQIADANGVAHAICAPTDKEADRIVAETMKRFGRLDVVINSSGITNGGPFHKIPPAEWDAAFASHFTSTLALARAAWPHLVASGNGRLVNTSSTSIFGAPYTSTYIAAKSAIFGASKAWSLEGETQGVRVNVVLPTAISQMTRNIPDPAFVAMLEQEYQPERVAGLVAMLVHRDTKLNGYAIEAGGGRAAHIFLAEGEQVKVDGSERPESWLPHLDALTSRQVRHTPISMMDELQQRLKDLGLASSGGDALVEKDSVWTPLDRR